MVFAKNTLLFHCKLIDLCGCQPNSIALLLSSDENEAIFCQMCWTNVFSVKENYSCKSLITLLKQKKHC